MLNLSIHPLERYDVLPSMDFTDENGNDALNTDNFYKNSLKLYEMRNMCKTWIVCDESRDDLPIGYFSVAMATIRVKDKLYPSMEILQLGVNKNERGKGMGREICVIAIGMATEFSIERIGFRYVGIESSMDRLAFFEKSYFMHYEDVDHDRTKIWVYYRIPDQHIK